MNFREQIKDAVYVVWALISETILMVQRWFQEKLKKGTSD